MHLMQNRKDSPSIPGNLDPLKKTRKQKQTNIVPTFTINVQPHLGNLEYLEETHQIVWCRGIGPRKKCFSHESQVIFCTVDEWINPMN